MEIKQFQTGKVSGLFLRLPDDATNIHCSSSNYEEDENKDAWITELSFDDSTDYCMEEDAPLFENHYEYFGLVKNITKEQCKSIVAESPFYQSAYKNYSNPDSSHKSDQPNSPSQSFETLLDSLDIFTEFSLIEPKFEKYGHNVFTSFDDAGGFVIDGGEEQFEIEMKKYEIKKALVGNWVLLIEVK